METKQKIKWSSAAITICVAVIIVFFTCELLNAQNKIISACNYCEGKNWTVTPAHYGGYSCDMLKEPCTSAWE